MAMVCPSCSGELVELDRSGVRIDACRNCRGVWLDRGELDRILERERQVVGAADDEEFIREMTGGGGKSSKPSYGFDTRTAEKIYSDYRHHKQHKKRKKSFLDELFD
jgi:Zn-finger nucleic acid-binding protein